MTKQIADRINGINAYMAKQQVEPADWHTVYRRIYSNGERADFRFDSGGRIYSVGDSYQQRKDFERASMRIRGEPPVELDIKASHPTIVHALLGVPLPPSGDPYAVPGICRAVKLWMVMLFGAGKFPQNWTSRARVKYAKKVGGDLSKVHSVKEVEAAARLHLPLIEAWVRNPVLWDRLQHIEAEAMMATIERLAFEYDVPALPVHDSILVPASMEALAARIFANEFERRVGIRPVIERKSG